MSTSGRVQPNMECLVCNVSVGDSARPALAIFKKKSRAKTPLSQVMSQVLGKNITRSTVHSVVLCKRCWLRFAKLKKLKQHMQKLRKKVVANYKHTIYMIKNRKKAQGKTSSDKENQVPELILDVPSSHHGTQDPSDNDSNIDATVGDVETLLYEEIPETTIEDIEINTNVIDSEAIDNSLDSNYQLPSGSQKVSISTKIFNDGNEVLLYEGDATVSGNARQMQDVPRWGCYACGETHSSKNLLDEHLNIHKSAGPYVCPTCGKKLKTKSTFRRHKMTHDIRPRSFHCDHCEKSFLAQNTLTQHKRMHLEDRQFLCDLCGKLFHTANKLRIHGFVHTGYKPFICGVCEKAFAQSGALREHERFHTGEHINQCQLCGRSFNRRGNLRAHMRTTHANNRQYKCQCGKAFNSLQNRLVHLYTHSDKKRYECSVCKTGFMRKSAIHRHMQAQGHLTMGSIQFNRLIVTTTEDGNIATVSGTSVVCENVEDNEPCISEHMVEMEQTFSDATVVPNVHQVVQMGQTSEASEHIVDVSEEEKLLIVDESKKLIEDSYFVQVQNPNEDMKEEDTWIEEKQECSKEKN